MKHDEMNQKRQQLLQDEETVSHHVKLYKAGKLWISAGITTAVLGVSTLMGVPVASAQTQTAPATSTAVSNTAPTSTSSTSTTTKDATPTSAATTGTSEATKSATSGDSTTTDQQQTSNSQQASASKTPTKTASVNDESSTVKPTSGDATNTVTKVTNLGAASSSQIDQAKAAASKQYAQTGQPQEVTATSATPEAKVTGAVKINYVDKATNAPLSFNSANDGFPSTAPATITGSYTATTTADPNHVTEMKVKDNYAEPFIEGYTFDHFGVGDTLNFEPVTTDDKIKTITAYYKNNAASNTTKQTTTQTKTPPAKTVTGLVTIKYVDETNNDSPISFDRDKAGFPPTAPATIPGQYTATTMISPNLVTKMKVKQNYAEPDILGYTFDKLGDGDTLNFAPNGKTITAYYKNNYAPTKTQQTTTPPEKVVTGQVTIDYVDKDTQQPLDFNSDDSSLRILTPTTQVSGSYTAQTKVPAADLGQTKVSNNIAQAEIVGYKFVGNDTTDFSFVPVGQKKTITAYYEKLAPVVVKYVNEADPSDVIYQIGHDTQSQEAMISGKADYNFDYEPTFYGYQYDKQKTLAANSLTGTGFKTLDETNGNPVVFNIYYKKTSTDPHPGAMYVDDPISVSPDDTSDAQQTNGAATPGFSFSEDLIPAVSRSHPSSKETIDGNEINQYAGYTMTGWTGMNNGRGNSPQALEETSYYISNQPVEVVFVDGSTNKVLHQESYGALDRDKGILPSGSYDTGVVNKDYQPTLDAKGYEYAKTLGQPKGTYDAMHRVVYYVYTPKLDTNYVPVTRVINFTSSDGSVNMNPVTETVWYKKLTNEVTDKSVYTPQNGYDQYVIPTIPGYLAKINGTPASVVAQEGLPATTGMPKNESVTVNYDQQPIDNGGGSTPGTPIEPITPTGTIDTNVPTPPIGDDTTKGKVPTPSTGTDTSKGKVPTSTSGKHGKTTVATGTDHGTAVANHNGSSTTTGTAEGASAGTATATGAAQGAQIAASNSAQAANSVNGTNANASATKSSQLPQTSEANDGAFGLVGAALMSMLGFLGIKKKRRD